MALAMSFMLTEKKYDYETSCFFLSVFGLGPAWTMYVHTTVHTHHTRATHAPHTRHTRATHTHMPHTHAPHTHAPHAPHTHASYALPYHLPHLTLLHTLTHPYTNSHAHHTPHPTIAPTLSTSRTSHIPNSHGQALTAFRYLLGFFLPPLWFFGLFYIASIVSVKKTAGFIHLSTLIVYVMYLFFLSSFHSPSPFLFIVGVRRINSCVGSFLLTKFSLTSIIDFFYFYFLLSSCFPHFPSFF
jgi:hypothetical protein